MSLDDKINQQLRTDERNPGVVHTYRSKFYAEENKYTFMTNAFKGMGGFRDGTYLEPHDREMFYLSRRKVSYYKNFVRGIIKSMINPVFVNRPQFTVTESEESKEPVDDKLFNTFLDDADNSGRTFSNFSKSVCKWARLHGVTFVVMDNFPDEMQPELYAEAIEDRILPYVYIRLADRVVMQKVDDFGELETIVFTDKPDPEDTSNPKRYKKWTREYSQVMKLVSDKYEPVGPRVEHNLGVVPVIPIFSVERDDLEVLLVDPPMYDIAVLNHTIYNKDSEIRAQERAQAFSVFYCPGKPSQMGTNLQISEKNVIWIPMESSTVPGFASPDYNILVTLREGNTELRKELFMLAQQNGVTGVEVSQSGVAKQWDFVAQEATLRDTTQMATILLRDVANLFKKYTGEEFHVSADYPYDFQPNDRQREMTILADYHDLVRSPKGRAFAEEKATRVVFADEPQERVDEIIEQIQTMTPTGDGDGDDGDATSEVTVGGEQISLNGIQIRSLLEILQKTVTGVLTEEGAVEIITATLPIEADVVRRMIAGTKKADPAMKPAADGNE